MGAAPRNFCFHRVSVWLCLFLSLVLGFIASRPLSAQVSGATLSGLVTDPSGAAVPGASLSINNTATGETRTVITDAGGLYSAPNLLPGKYDVKASAAGFATEMLSGITLTVGAQMMLNINVKVGQISQTVEVTAAAPQVELTNATIGAVLDESTVRELPLNGRDWTSLASLQAGVTSDASLQPSATQGAGFARGQRGLGVQLTVNGNRPEQNNYRIDGIGVNDFANGGMGSATGATLGVDAIQEFSVLTSDYGAEYGRTSGGVVNAITRSGANQLHGTLFWFLRSNKLDGKGFFDPVRPPFHRNQFGAAEGGPIQKDKTFFFANYEGFRQTQGVSSVDVVPSADTDKGILHNADGTTTTVTVDPLVAPFLALWHLPNPNALIGAGLTGTYTFTGIQFQSEDFVSARVDHKFSQNDSLFGSYQIDRSSSIAPDSLGDLLNGTTSRHQLVSLEESHVFSSTFVNSARLGYNRIFTLLGASLGAINPAAGNPALGAAPGRYAPLITVPGIASFSGGLNSNTHTRPGLNDYQFYDDAFLVKGKHSFKFGIGFERLQEDVTQYARGGNFKFGTIAAFLQNQPTSLSDFFFNAQQTYGWRQSIASAYMGDDIHLRSNLTINVGLRYEMSTVPYEVNGYTAILHQITEPKVEINTPFWHNPTLYNFEPRIGLAWDPFGDGKTSIRSGFGMFDVLPLPYLWYTSIGQGAPFVLSGSATNLPPGSFPTAGTSLAFASTRLADMYINPKPKRNYVMQWNMSIQRQLSSSLTATLSYIGSRGVHQVTKLDDANVVMPAATTAEGLLWPLPGTGTVLNPLFGKEIGLDWGSSSFYDGLQAQLLKKMGHGLQGQVVYTWSHCIDEGSASKYGDEFINGISGLLSFVPSSRRGACDYDIRHNVIVNFMWDVPSPSSLHGPERFLAQGWELGSIVGIHTGIPFSVLIAGDPVGMGNTAAYDVPNYVPGCSAVNPGNIKNYINTKCFTLPMATPDIAARCVAFSNAPGTCSNLLGNNARNSLNGPGYWNVDFSAFKNNKITEKFNLQFRAELFNLFNHPNFGSPVNNSTIFDATGTRITSAGLIDTTTTTSRQIQLALKLIW